MISMSRFFVDIFAGDEDEALFVKEAVVQENMSVKRPTTKNTLQFSCRSWISETLSKPFGQPSSLSVLLDSPLLMLHVVIDRQMNWTSINWLKRRHGHLNFVCIKWIKLTEISVVRARGTKHTLFSADSFESLIKWGAISPKTQALNQIPRLYSTLTRARFPIFLKLCRSYSPEEACCG